MASTVTLKHYSDTNTTADTSVTMPIANTGYRLINIRSPLAPASNWDSCTLHSLEMVISAETTMVGCEILAIGLDIMITRLDK